jgi:hypothetical protein
LNESKFEEVKNDLMLSNEGNNGSFDNIFKWIENHGNQNNNNNLIMIERFEEVKKTMETNYDETVDKLSKVDNSILFSLNEGKGEIKMLIDNHSNNVIKNISDNAVKTQSNLNLLNERFKKFNEESSFSSSNLTQLVQRSINVMDELKTELNDVRNENTINHTFVIQQIQNFRNNQLQLGHTIKMNFEGIGKKMDKIKET